MSCVLPYLQNGDPTQMQLSCASQVRSSDEPKACCCVRFCTLLGAACCAPLLTQFHAPPLHAVRAGHANGATRPYPVPPSATTLPVAPATLPHFTQRHNTSGSICCCCQKPTTPEAPPATYPVPHSTSTCLRPSCIRRENSAQGGYMAMSSCFLRCATQQAG